jgi:hypothetical protein
MSRSRSISEGNPFAQFALSDLVEVYKSAKKVQMLGSILVNLDGSVLLTTFSPFWDLEGSIKWIKPNLLNVGVITP